MHDVFFISYREPNAGDNWRRAKSLVPRARRLDGIEGLVRAYKTAATLSHSPWFFIIDGDNWLLDASIFDHQPDPPEAAGRLYVWPSRNSLNGLEYGNGAVKLYSKHAALSVADDVEDFSIAVCQERIKYRTIAAETRIDGSPFQAWRAGFREGYKLHRRIAAGEGNAERQYRIWTTRGADRPNGTYAIAGARRGHHAFGDDPKLPINDRSFVEELFEEWRQATDETVINSHRFCSLSSAD